MRGSIQQGIIEIARANFATLFGVAGCGVNQAGAQNAAAYKISVLPTRHEPRRLRYPGVLYPAFQGAVNLQRSLANPRSLLRGGWR